MKYIKYSGSVSVIYKDTRGRTINHHAAVILNSTFDLSPYEAAKKMGHLLLSKLTKEGVRSGEVNMSVDVLVMDKNGDLIASEFHILETNL